MSDSINPSYGSMIVFFAVWYFFTILTYGTNVPAGLFLPGMIIGCAIGDLYATSLNKLDLLHDDKLGDNRKKYIILGCGGFMAGYTRMTYSLAIILMETSQDITIFVPMIFCIIVSNQVGYRFTRSLYQRAVRTKQMPIITDKIPGPCRHLKTGDIMAKKVVKFRSVETMENVAEALLTKHHAFPIVNQNNNLIGIIPRNFLVVLIKHQGFYNDKQRNVLDHSVSSQLTTELQTANALLRNKLIAKN